MILSKQSIVPKKYDESKILKVIFYSMFKIDQESYFIEHNDFMDYLNKNSYKDLFKIDSSNFIVNLDDKTINELLHTKDIVKNISEIQNVVKGGN